MQETCLICTGTKQLCRGEVPSPCPYCAGTGRVKVQSEGPQTVLMATGYCKMPVRKVVLDGGLKVERKHVPTP